MFQIIVCLCTVTTLCATGRMPSKDISGIPGIQTYEEVKRDTLNASGSESVYNSNIGTLHADGAITISNSQVNKLYGCGALHITGSSIGTAEVGGSLDMQSTTVKHVSVDGAISCSNCTGDTFIISGSIDAHNSKIDRLEVYQYKADELSQPLIQMHATQAPQIAVYAYNAKTVPRVEITNPKTSTHVVFNGRSGVVKTNAHDKISVENGSVERK